MSENEEPQVSEQQPEQPESESIDPSVDEAIEAVSEESVAGKVEASSSDNLESQLAEANDQILKLHAELDNVRKRVRREADDRVKYASLPVMLDLLAVGDNLKRAIEAAKQSESSGGLVEGVEMVVKMFEDVMAKHHCRPIPALGETFDPNYHEAISQMPSDDYESGIVMLEATQGFQLHDRVVRPSQVIVSTGQASSDSADSSQ